MKTQAPMETITEDEFDERFTLIDFDDGDQTTDDFEEIKKYPTNRVWSLVDDGDGGMCLVTGFATVNFVAWQVTEQEHPGGYCDITVEMPELDFEDETDDEELDTMLHHIHEEEND